MSTELENKLITAKSIKTVYDDIDNAKMDKENPVGTGSFSLNRKSNSTVGTNSVAIGNNTIASGVSSVAMGDSTKATGDYSFAMGYNSEASGIGSIAIGYDDKILNKVVASGKNSIAMGEDARATADGAIAMGDATASGEQSVAIGSLAKSSGGESVAIGRGTASGENAIAIGSGEAIGNYSHACGNGIAIGERSYAEGFYTVASGYGSHVEGYNYADIVTLTGDANSTTYTCSNINYCKIGYYVRYENEIVKIVEVDVDNSIITTDKTLSSESINHSCKILHSNGASGSYSHSEGCSTAASGNYGSHAEGYYTTASGDSSHAEGRYTTASGDYSHAEGYDTTAFGSSSHAEGYNTMASGPKSHAEGLSTAASGDISHAEGNNTRATGAASHAEGQGAKASGDVSHAEGNGTIAIGWCQHVQGKHNIQDGKYAHIVGNGTSSKRSNAHTLDWDGNAWFAGDIHVGGTDYNDSAAKKLVSSDEISDFATETYVATAIANAQLSGNDVDLSGFATKDDLADKADKTHTHKYAGSSSAGGSATKAIGDGDGNNIINTYATKTELNGKANSSHSHSISDVTNLQTTLNNKLSITGGTSISSGDDLNNYTTPGVYIAGNSTIASSLTNSPTKATGFKLFVIDGYISGRVTQIVTTNTNDSFYRQKQESNWLEWINITKIPAADQAGGSALTAISDQNGWQIDRAYQSLVAIGKHIPAYANLKATEFLKVGNYYCSSNDTAKTLTGAPTATAFKMEVYSPIKNLIDNENSTWVYRVRKVMTLDGKEFIQSIVSKDVAGEFTFSEWDQIFNSGNVIPISNGGTGQDFKEAPDGKIPPNAVIRNSSDESGFWYTRSYSGALYSTGTDKALSFGTLPIAQGGTGATTPEGALDSLGLSKFGYYGYTAVPTNSDWNNATTNGWYTASNNAPNIPDAAGSVFVGYVAAYNSSHIVQTAWIMSTASVYFGCCAQREKNVSGWQEWKWINPPMTTQVEYLTTEKFNGQKVYTKLICIEGLHQGTSNTSIGISAHNIIRSNNIIYIPENTKMVSSPYFSSTGSLLIKHLFVGTQLQIITNDNYTDASAYFQLWYIK